MDTEQIKSLKAHFIQAIIHKEKRRLKENMNDIQNQHSLVHGSRAFMLDGKPVWNGDAAAARTKGKMQLAPELQEKARKIIVAQTRLNSDEQRLTNFFGMIAQRCHDLQDYRDVLPDMVVERMTHHEITGIPRTREPGYIFASSPIKLKAFQDGMDIAYRYLVNELVF